MVDRQIVPAEITITSRERVTKQRSISGAYFTRKNARQQWLLRYAYGTMLYGNKLAMKLYNDYLAGAGGFTPLDVPIFQPLGDGFKVGNYCQLSDTNSKLYKIISNGLLFDEDLGNDLYQAGSQSFYNTYGFLLPGIGDANAFHQGYPADVGNPTLTDDEPAEHIHIDDDGFTYKGTDLFDNNSVPLAVRLGIIGSQALGISFRVRFADITPRQTLFIIGDVFEVFIEAGVISISCKNTESDEYEAISFEDQSGTQPLDGWPIYNFVNGEDYNITFTARRFTLGGDAALKVIAYVNDILVMDTEFTSTRLTQAWFQPVDVPVRFGNIGYQDGTRFGTVLICSSQIPVLDINTFLYSVDSLAKAIQDGGLWTVENIVGAGGAFYKGDTPIPYGFETYPALPSSYPLTSRLTASALSGKFLAVNRDFAVDLNPKSFIIDVELEEAPE